MSIETINPANGQVIQTYKEMSSDAVAEIIDSSHTAFLTWRQFDFNKRATYLRRVAALLRQHKTEFSYLMATEMGKPLAQGEAEIEKCAMVCEHYATNAEGYLSNKSVQTEMRQSYVTYQPLGIVFAIMPWNFPFWQVFRFAAPTLMAGNSAILKHAPISTGTALAIEALFKEADCPDNLFRSLIIAEDKANDVISNPLIKAVTLTGSTRAGKSVGAEAAAQIKKSVLELGGSDPYIVLDDADIELAVDAIVKSRMNNAGQSCIAAKRLIVTTKNHDSFVEFLLNKIKTFKMGDPTDPQTTCGPLARKDLRDHLHEQVEACVSQGAELKLGGVIPSQTGFYYPPTLLTNIKEGMPAYNEELFGPVFSVIHADNEDEAIKIANDTIYGLGAAIFSTNLARAQKIAEEDIHAGTCVINTLVVSDPRLPFGGINESGYGRELSAEGIQSFVNIKTINIK